MFSMANAVSLPFRVFEAPEVSSFDLHSSHDVYDHFNGYAAADREMFIIIFLNSKNKAFDLEVHSIGDVDCASVYPRQVFRSALLKNCSSLICIHNHPSGDLDPSAGDKDITMALVSAGCMLNISVLDHLIITRTGYFSFADHGLIEEYRLKAKLSG